MQIQSHVDSSSTDFVRNSEAMRGLVAELRERLNLAAGGGGKAARSRHIARGKMLARDRVDLLIDPGTAFLELSPLAANGLYGGEHGDGVDGGAAQTTRDYVRPARSIFSNAPNFRCSAMAALVRSP